MADGTIPPPEVAAAPRRSASYTERRLVVAGFVGVWMGLGWLLGLGANEYLLLGVPLTLLFQLLVRRQPVRALWVRDAPPLRVNLAWMLTTAALAALPLYELLRTGLERGWVIAAWRVCAVLGAPAAAYAIQHYRRESFRTLSPVLVMVGSLSVLMLAAGIFRHGPAILGGQAALQAVRWTLLYFPVCFVLEEVTFRGALDGYLYRPGGTPSLGSAAELSFLWGIWHLPIVVVEHSMVMEAFRLGMMHMIVGVPLTLAWRTSGSLLVPAAAHALLDGVRNGLRLFP